MNIPRELGTLPSREPNRHRMDAWQPPMVYPADCRTRHEKAAYRAAYNKKLAEARHERYLELKRREAMGQEEVDGLDS